MEQLMLVSTEDLLKGLKSRCELFAVVFTNKDDTGEKIQSRWSKANSWLELIGLVNVLRSNVELEFQKVGE